MIAFIDCYINTPVNTCINQFTENTLIPSTYHMISKFGLESLINIKTPTCYIILGSAAHISENHPWQQELLNFIIPKLENGIPVLGICYGHQLVADYYGCKIDYINRDKEHLKTVRDINLISPIGNLLPTTLRLAYSHSQVIKELSNNFEAIGHSRFSAFEIIKHKIFPFIGIQAHPEASVNFITKELNRINDSERILNDGLHFLSEYYRSF